MMGIMGNWEGREREGSEFLKASFKKLGQTYENAICVGQK